MKELQLSLVPRMCSALAGLIRAWLLQPIYTTGIVNWRDERAASRGPDELRTSVAPSKSRSSLSVWHFQVNAGLSGYRFREYAKNLALGILILQLLRTLE
jgi:hypothetical protein